MSYGRLCHSSRYSQHLRAQSRVIHPRTPFIQRPPNTLEHQTNDTHISNETPNATPIDIQTLLASPVPALSIITDLVACIKASSPVTARSVVHKSAGEMFFLLWVITYWHGVNHTLIHQQSWMKCHQAL